MGRRGRETVCIGAGIAPAPGIRIAERLPERADAVPAGRTIVAVTCLSRRNRARDTKREGAKKRDQSFPVHVKSPERTHFVSASRQGRGAGEMPMNGGGRPQQRR